MKNYLFLFLIVFLNINCAEKKARTPRLSPRDIAQIKMGLPDKNRIKEVVKIDIKIVEDAYEISRLHQGKAPLIEVITYLTEHGTTIERERLTGDFLTRDFNATEYAKKRLEEEKKRIVDSHKIAAINRSLKARLLKRKIDEEGNETHKSDETSILFQNAAMARSLKKTKESPNLQALDKN